MFNVIHFPIIWPNEQFARRQTMDQIQLAVSLINVVIKLRQYHLSNTALLRLGAIFLAFSMSQSPNCLAIYLRSPHKYIFIGSVNLCIAIVAMVIRSHGKRLKNMHTGIWLYAKTHATAYSSVTRLDDGFRHNLTHTYSIPTFSWARQAFSVCMYTSFPLASNQTMWYREQV